MPAKTQSEKTTARTQQERSGAMRKRLIDATITSLVERGYAQTTAVEVCARAGVTRGALFHHFESLAALLVAALEDTYERFFILLKDGEATISLDERIGRVWEKVQQVEFKAVIEIWLAVRNAPEMAPTLQPVIARYAQIFAPENRAAETDVLGRNPESRAFYRLTMETMIGLALGRATTPGNKALPHEQETIALLQSFARHYQ